MGSRGSIVVVEDGKEIWFYTHWDGHVIKQLAAEALEHARPRWGDPSYCNRMIFSYMIQNHVMGDTGFGISSSETDYEYPPVYIYHDSQSVRTRRSRHSPLESWSFGAFTKEFEFKISLKEE